MREKDLMRVRRKLGVLFQDGALFGSLNLFDNIAFPLREHTRKSEKEIKRDHPREGQPGRPPRPPEEVPRRGVGRHEEAGRPGPGPGHGPRDRPVRRARLGPRPRARVLPRRAGEEDPGGDRRHVLHHHPQHPVGHAHRRPHRRALPSRPRAASRAKEEMAPRDDPIIRQFLAGRADGPIGMDELATEETEVERELVARASARQEARPTETATARSCRSDGRHDRPAGRQGRRACSGRPASWPRSASRPVRKVFSRPWPCRRVPRPAAGSWPRSRPSR